MRKPRKLMTKSRGQTVEKPNPGIVMGAQSAREKRRVPAVNGYFQHHLTKINS
jgi:hypothetical protein